MASHRLHTLLCFAVMAPTMCNYMRCNGRRLHDAQCKPILCQHRQDYAVQCYAMAMSPHAARCYAVWRRGVLD
eukprot:9257690-Pyramimonas_sp.AAC.1